MKVERSANLGNLSLRRVVLVLTACFLLISASLLFVALHRIGTDVRAACYEATQEFGGDCVEALASYVASADRTFEERNRAIWALGEIGDARALPALQGLLDGELIGTPCHVRRGICRYSVEKAIALCDGVNIVRWVWWWI